LGKRNKKKKHQAYFANKINIYEDKNSCEIRKKKKKDKNEKKKKKKKRDTSQNTSTHTHTDLRDENGREREERETGITVIRTVSSAYAE
jgi:hypothetical protein